jgi:DNA replication ATP-dependent helicase Dna2
VAVDHDMNELDALVEGIDGSFWDAVPSPVKQPRTPTKKSPSLDLTDFLAGDWNLDDDPFTPQKPKPPTKLPPVDGPEPTTRCVVDAVLDDPELVEGRWSRVIHAHVYKKEEDARVVYLQDDWYDTPVRAGASHATLLSTFLLT